MRKFRFRNSSFISAVSVALVLCLIGAECVLLLSAGALVTRMREGLSITAVLMPDADSTHYAQMESYLAEDQRCIRYTFVSKEQALQKEIPSLGMNPEEFLGFNPLGDEYEIHIAEAYTHPDSLTVIIDQLSELPYVCEVSYPMKVATVIGRPVQRILWIIFIVALVLLLVAYVLIVNTIRLQIYAKRFLINTMTLVGATPWVTRRPFVRRNMLMGFVAGVVAVAIVLAGVLFFNTRFLPTGEELLPLTFGNISLIVVVVIGSGLLITLLASLIATGRYIRMDNNTLYEI